MRKSIETEDGKHKPIIETIVNSLALALTSLGMVKLNSDQYIGFPLIAFGVGLEFFKYWGRKKKLW